MPSFNRNQAALDPNFRGVGPGVVIGLVVRDPQSATLSTTIEGGWILQNTASTQGQLTRIADTAKTFTASKDTYVYITAAGALAYNELANGATKPSQAAIEALGGVGSQLIAKVVTDGSRVTDGGVSDLRQIAGVDMQSFSISQSFATTETGAAYWVAPGRVRVWKAVTVAVDTLAGTDAGTVTLAAGVNDKYTDMTNGATSLAASSATGTRASALPSGYFIVDTGQAVRLTSAKTTSGGNAYTQVFYSFI